MSLDWDWKQRLAGYFRNPVAAWGNPKERQVIKLQSVLARASQQHGLAVEPLIETLIDAVEMRDPAQQQPVYLVNLGGCGSHWLSRMMAQSSNLTDAGEVYLPAPWYESMPALPTNIAARLLDGIELAHGLLYDGTPGKFTSARMINSAHGCEKIAFYRQLRPRACVIHLIRDPRDRTMSVSFRKDEFRRYENTGLDDFDYFMSKAQRSLAGWAHYTRLSDKADVEVRYEDLRKDCAGRLQHLLATIGLPAPPGLVKAVAYRNSPQFLRSPQGRKLDRGNLDQGGIARSWRDLPPDFTRALHSVVAPAVLGQRYRLCDCFPGLELQALPKTEGLAAALAKFDSSGTSDALVDLRHDGSDHWQPIARVENTDGVLRLRIRPRKITISEASLECLRPWITDFCAAGIKAFGNAELNAIGQLPSLQALDLARTGIASPPVLTAFPALRALNLSGTPVVGMSSAEFKIVRDY